MKNIKKKLDFNYKILNGYDADDADEYDEEYDEYDEYDDYTEEDIIHMKKMKNTRYIRQLEAEQDMRKRERGKRLVKRENESQNVENIEFKLTR